MSASHTRRSLISAAAAVISEAAIKVPQKFIDHARSVGSTVLYAELTYRNWKPRGLTDQQILDKITKHGKEQKKEESVEEMAASIEEAVTIELDEAKYGENTPERKIAAAKSFIKQYEQSLKHAIADGKPAETVNFWKKRLEKEKKALTALMKNESVEELDEAFTPEARKAIQLVTNLDAVDMEQFLQGFALYLDNSVVDDGDDFDKLGKIINKARQTWKARKGN